jgi:integrase
MASIKKRENGQWRARYRDDAGKEHARHFDRKVDAQRWLNETTASVVTGSYVDPKAGRITFANYFKDWSSRQVWAPGTVKAMRLAAGSVTFANVQLRSVKRSHVEAWVKGMDVKGLAPGTINTRFNNVRGVLRAAHRDKLIPTDPSEDITLPRRRRAEAAMTIPTPEQVGAMIAAADVWFRPFIGLCAFAGLRLGEAAAVQADDIDFLRRSLAVTRQAQRENGGGVEIRPPKCGSERVVYLPDGLIQMLAAHIGRVGAESAEGWLFVGEGDGPPHQNTVGYWWRKTLKDAGLSNYRLHDLRHFFASGLISEGCDVVTVQRALGHSSATTTLNTYSHLWPTAADRTRQAAQAMMASALAVPADSLRTHSR